MRVVRSALKHGYNIDDIRHAFTNAQRLVEYEYQGQERLLIIGPARDGTLMELVAVDLPDPDRIIHADTLRPKFYDYLR